MKSVLVAMMIGFAMLVGCGSDDSGEGSSGSSGESSSNCDQQYGCINGSCQCEAGPKKGQSCCDPDDSGCSDDKCDSYCRYCS